MVDNFPEGISSKVNVTLRLEFELAHLEAAVQHCSHYVSGIPLYIMY